MDVSFGLDHGVTHDADAVAGHFSLSFLLGVVSLEVIQRFVVKLDGLGVLFEHLVDLGVVVVNHETLLMNSFVLRIFTFFIIQVIE